MNKIFETIKKSRNILLTLHPGPDGDSVGANLAFYIFLKRLKKNVTLISGDSKLPINYSTLPFAKNIIEKNIVELDLKNYDLIVLLDIAGKSQISRINDIKFSKNSKIINIDHHVSNKGIGNINLINKNSPSTCEMIFRLFEKWSASRRIKIDKNIAACLITGIYDDCQFKYDKVNFKTYDIASKLAKINPQFNKYLFEVDNNNSPEKIKFLGIALSHIETFFNNQIAISLIPFDIMEQNRFPKSTTENTDISNILKSVIGWNIGISFFEYMPNKIKISMRTRDPKKFDVSKLARALNGGGHVSAAGANLNMPFKEAKKTLLETIKKVYKLN